MSATQPQNPKTPALRFPEFSGEWEEKRLGEICSIARGKFSIRPRNDPRYFGGNTPFVQTGDIANSTGYLLKYNQTLNELGVTVSKVFPSNTILMTIAANIGDVTITKFPVACPDSLVGIIPNKGYDTYFIFSYLSTRKQELYGYATQNAQANINLQILNPLNIPSPTLPEQQKISQFLGAVDEKIAALKQKQTLLEAYKKGVMQQLFSQSLRFTRPDGTAFPEWEYVSADKIFISHSNKSHDGSLPILSIVQNGGAVYREDVDIDIKATQASVMSYKVVEPGDFIISLRSFQGGIEYSNILGICSPAYTILKPIMNIYNDFYKFFFKTESFISRLSLTVVGIRDGKQISYSAFSTLTLPYPHPDEQKRIADFLTSLDTKIDAVKRQITHIEAFKKGLLQQMFV